MALPSAKKCFFLIIFCYLINCQFGYSQQLPLFTQYRENHSLINPATINSDNFTHEYNMSVGASYRMQWVSESFTPRTQTARIEYLYNRGEGVSLIYGGSIVNDQIGPTGMTGVSGRIGGILSDDPYWGGFVTAINFGISQFRIKTKEIKSYDPLVNQCDCRSIKPDIGFGIFAYKRFSGGTFDQDVIYGGLSMPQAFAFAPTFNTDQGEEFKTTRVSHYYALIGLYKYLSDFQFIEPSIWVKYVKNAPINIDFNLRYTPVEHLWIGVGYATSRTLHLEIGFLLSEKMDWDNNLRIGYGFDRGFNEYGPDFGSAHEINITYLLDR